MTAQSGGDFAVGGWGGKRGNEKPQGRRELGIVTSRSPKRKKKDDVGGFNKRKKK